MTATPPGAVLYARREDVATVRTRRQRLGQHFLRDAGVARAIVAALPEAPARVLEIGPGRGALTRVLLERFSLVRAVELDAALANDLPRRLGSPGHLEVRLGDALTLDLDELAESEPWQVAANLPYAVATPILRRLVHRGDLFPVLVVMVQHEVARRIVAGEGDAERGLLTVEIGARARAELLFPVPARCFSPPPRVTSAVVRLVPRELPAPPAVLARALELAAAAFSHRRKKLANALAAAGEPHELASAFTAAGVSPDVRPQELAIGRWLALAAALPAAGPPAGPAAGVATGARAGER
jgi:16S rRNA (adenine1518-N6/adenine1519-N6)-dimethyltransferase